MHRLFLLEFCQSLQVAHPGRQGAAPNVFKTH